MYLCVNLLTLDHPRSPTDTHSMSKLPPVDEVLPTLWMWGKWTMLYSTRHREWFSNGSNWRWWQDRKEWRIEEYKRHFCLEKHQRSPFARNNLNASNNIYGWNVIRLPGDIAMTAIKFQFRRSRKCSGSNWGFSGTMWNRNAAEAATNDVDCTSIMSDQTTVLACTGVHVSESVQSKMHSCPSQQGRFWGNHAVE